MPTPCHCSSAHFLQIQQFGLRTPLHFFVYSELISKNFPPSFLLDSQATAVPNSLALLFFKATFKNKKITPPTHARDVKVKRKHKIKWETFAAFLSLLVLTVNSGAQMQPCLHFSVAGLCLLCRVKVTSCLQEVRARMTQWDGSLTSREDTWK